MRKPKGQGKPFRKTLEARQKQDSDMEHNILVGQRQVLSPLLFLFDQLNKLF